MANINNTSSMSVKATTVPLTPRKSALEEKYEHFMPELIIRAEKAKTSAAPLMHDLNRIRTLCAGMGTVMRIVSGNSALKDGHEPTDENSEPPLSDLAIGSLTDMVALLCESINADIAIRANKFYDQVPA